MRKVSVLLIVLGSLVLAYPFLLRYQESKLQEELLMNVEIENDFLVQNANSATEQTDEMPEIEFVMVENTEVVDSYVIKETVSVEIDEDLPYETIGILEIEKIELKLPVLNNCTNEALKIGAGRLGDLETPEDKGNFVLAGHRSKRYGWQFNRLDEMEQGDQIIYKADGKSYKYDVVSVFIVSPEDVWVAGTKENVEAITLITCTEDSKQRLVVKGTLQK